jgi:tRNA G18 (ribose-2'-O)-methylase SpoU
MPIVAVEDAGDRRLDDYRNVPDPVLLAERGIFVAEGRLVVRRLLCSSRFAARSLLLTPTALSSLADLASKAADGISPVPVYVVPQQVMNGITGFNLHRGCLAIGERRPAEAPPDVVAVARRIVVAERVGNADNVGAIFRNAAALGAGAVLLDPASTDPLYRKAIRTSMGAALHVPFARATPWPDTLGALQAAGFVLVGLTLSPAAAPVRAVAATLTNRRVAVVVGHEGEGLSEAALAACDVQARIPMAAGVDSLNVATATAIALYELETRR